MFFPKKYPLCSDCFRNEGLRLDSQNIGIELDKKCPKCKSRTGKKLNTDLITSLSHRFFVKGTFLRTNFGGAPIIQFNQHQKTSVKFDKGLTHDVKLIERAIKVGFFRYGPRLWMLGDIEPLQALISKSERNSVINQILVEYPTRTIHKSQKFYRIRVNPESPEQIAQYDSPPNSGTGRLDSKNLSIMYASSDLEICIHECRVTVEDEVYVATIRPKNDLRILDLTELLREDGTEFESLDIAIHMLFLAKSHSYEVSRDIAIAAYKKGFDGIIYPSYFSIFRTGAMPFDTAYGISIRRLEPLQQRAIAETIPNIALFGRPVQDRKVEVTFINKLTLNRVGYDYQFGPVNFE